MARANVARRARSGSVGRLVDRQLAVLRALATGLSTAEAAERLGIDAEQARANLVDAMRVLNAHTKLEAILAAHRSGLLGLDQEQVEGSRASA